MADGNFSVKTCSTCKAEKLRTDFYIDKKTKDGLYCRCKICHNGTSARWKAANALRVKEVAAQRYSVHGVRIRQENRAWEIANPEKLAAKKKRLYDANPEKYRAISLDYIDRNKEQVRLRQRDRYWNDRDAFLQKQREHKQRNPALFKKHELIRRYSKEQATPSWANQFFIAEAYRLARLRETLCGGKWHVDHIVPLKSKLVCGFHCEANLQVIPAIDNLRKSNRYWPDRS